MESWAGLNGRLVYTGRIKLSVSTLDTSPNQPTIRWIIHQVWQPLQENLFRSFCTKVKFEEQQRYSCQRMNFWWDAILSCGGNEILSSSSFQVSVSQPGNSNFFSLSRKVISKNWKWRYRFFWGFIWTCKFLSNEHSLKTYRL